MHNFQEFEKKFADMEKVTQLEDKVKSELSGLKDKKTIINSKLQEIQDTDSLVEIQRRKKVIMPLEDY